MAVNDVEFEPMQNAFGISKAKDDQNSWNLAPSEILVAPHYLREYFI